MLVTTAGTEVATENGNFIYFWRTQVHLVLINFYCESYNNLKIIKFVKGLITILPDLNERRKNVATVRTSKKA